MRNKICLISSSGGHLSQLKELLPVARKYNFFVVTERNEMSRTSFDKDTRSYYLKQQERKNIGFLLLVLINMIISCYIVIKERPGIVISTGAGVVVPLCILAKLFGAKLIFIESFAKINSPTLTGRTLYRFSNRFYIQWKELREYYPKAIYKGAIY